MKFQNFLFCFFYILSVTFLFSFEIGEKIYLNGVGGKGEKYFSTPFKLESIEECDNLITSMEKSPYGRDFRTKSTLSIDIDGKKITASLSDFRDLVVKDEKENILLKSKITGATSLYKIIHKGKIIAFAVGWHRNEREFHKEIDFTVFRVILPVIKNNELKIEERLFKGLSQSFYEKGFKTNHPSILVEAKSVGVGASGLYYGLPEFIIIDNVDGFKPINDAKILKCYADILTYDSLVMLLWLIEQNDVEEFKDYMQKNINYFFDDPEKKQLIFAKEKKDVCITAIKKFQGPFNMKTLAHLFNHCLTDDLDSSENIYTFKSWLEDVLNK